MPPVSKKPEPQIAPDTVAPEVDPILAETAPSEPGPRARPKKAAKDAAPPVAAAVGAFHANDAGDDEQEPVARLIEESEGFFGEPSFIAAGAFSPLAEHNITSLTRVQGRAIIDAWLESNVEDVD